MLAETRRRQPNVSRKIWRVLRLSAAILAASPSFVAPQELAFLGPRGTYSEEAANTYRERATDVRSTVPMSSITEVVGAVTSGKAERGIIPAESTRAGVPIETAGLILRNLDPGFRIIDEMTISIELQLLGKPGTALSGIREILSHPNALKEAGEYLRAHFRDVPLRETPSTAAAAETVSKGDGTTAAIAGRAAAQLFALETLASAIQDDKDNATSFWVIAPASQPVVEKTPNRIVIALEAPPGSALLSSTLADLYKERFSVVSLSSAPLPGEIHGYRYVPCSAQSALWRSVK
jgi:prephenate dehydratase